MDLELTIKGKKVTLPGVDRETFAGLTREEQDAVVEDVAADMQKRGLFDPTVKDFVVHGASGFNEGVGNLVGAPFDWWNNAVNLGIDATNTVMGTEFGHVNPLLGSEQIKGAMSSAGMTVPPSENDALEFTRRITQEVGANALPGLGIASRVAKPVGLIGAELAAATGAGTGAAIAEKVFPGNPWAEMAGTVVGAFTPGGAAATVRRAKGINSGPSVPELQAAKDAAYKAVEDAGVTYSGTGYKRLVDNIVNEALDSNISQTRHAAAFDFIADIEKRHPNGLTLNDLDLIRQEAKRDLLDSANRADRHFGEIVVDQIDEFIETADGADISFGRAGEGAEAIKAARAAHRQLRTTELVDAAIERANLNAASAGSGGNINNALRQQLKTLITDKRKSRSFTTEQLDELKNVVEQGKMEGLLRWVGKVSPGGNGLALLIHLVGTISNPAWAMVPLAGAAAKHAADTGTINKVNALRGNIASGGALAIPPKVSPNALRTGAALSIGSGANLAANDNALKRIRAIS